MLFQGKISVVKILRKLRLLDWLVLFATFLFSYWLMASTFGYKDGQIWMDSKLYSDFGAHLPLIRSFSFGSNFPPEYPFFAGEPIRYHYLFYLLVGLLEKLGLRIDWALNIPSVLGFWLLLMMIYRLTLSFFRSRLAGVLAIILFLFNGSLSFVEYFDQQGWSITSLMEIPQQKHFASFGPWSGRPVSAFWSLNVYTNQRHLGLSYGLVLLGLLPLLTQIGQANRKKVKGKFLRVLHKLFLSRIQHLKKMLNIKHPNLRQLNLWLILLFFFLPILHQAGYMMLLYLSGCLLIFYGHKYSAVTKLSYVLAIALSLISFKFLTTGSSQPISLTFGYLAEDKTWLGLLSYWWFNLGVYLLLIPILLIFGWIKQNYLLLFSLGLFVVVNVTRLSPDMINNHKLINFFMIIVVIFTAGLLVSWLKRGWFSAVISLLIVPSLIFSGVMDLFPIINDTTGGVDDWRKSAMQSWIKDNTSTKAQFLTASYMYSPASLVGRQIYLDYGYHAWSMGYDDHQKRQLLPQLWSATISLDKWCGLMYREGLDYVLVGPGERATEDGRISVDQSRLVREIPPSHQSADGWQVWQVQTVCDNSD